MPIIGVFFFLEMLLCKQISIFFPSMLRWQAHLSLFYYFLKINLNQNKNREKFKKKKKKNLKNIKDSRPAQRGWLATLV
jgi:hypothetical protein